VIPTVETERAKYRAAGAAKKSICYQVRRRLDWPFRACNALAPLAADLSYDPGMNQVVIVRRQFDRPLTAERVRSLMEKNNWCWVAHDAELLISYLAADGMSSLCVYSAPDAESVRIANRKAQLPAEEIWTATEHLSLEAATLVSDK
jgi:hypothetical protein